MKSILLKLDDELFYKTEILVKETNLSRNSYIKKAVEVYNKLLERKKLALQFANESMLVREESMDINKEISLAYLEDFGDEY